MPVSNNKLQPQAQPEASTSTTTTVSPPSATGTFVVDTETAARANDYPSLTRLDWHLPYQVVLVPHHRVQQDSILERVNLHPLPHGRKVHLSEHERAKRMSEFYFDVGKWEEDLARRLLGEEGTKERKRK